jgi:syntaxin 8
MSNPSQLLLLSDHIKLSLLERQRAISLNLDPNPTQDSHISRSLESLREGIAALETKSPGDTDSLNQIRSQYNDLSRQFHGDSSSNATDTLLSPNDPSLAEDFTHAQSKMQQTSKTARSSNLKTQESIKPSPKNVRFRDNPSTDSLDDANRAALFPARYTDDEARSTTPDPNAKMSNQQIHQYHQQVLQEQDDQLDTLSESIGRQRHLSMQIGDELEGQVALIDEVDRGVDRHQSRLNGATRRLKIVGAKAKANWGMTIIIVLIVILVLLIAVLK